MSTKQKQNVRGKLKGETYEQTQHFVLCNYRFNVQNYIGVKPAAIEIDLSAGSLR